MDRSQQGLVFNGQMIRLEDGSEVSLSALIEDARRQRGAEIRRLFFAGVATVRRLLGRAESVRVRRRTADWGAPGVDAAATAAYRSDAALGHCAGAPGVADADQPAVNATAPVSAPKQLAA